MAYLNHLMTIVFIYAILALAVDILYGHLGMVSLSHAAFSAIGAYTTALLSINAGVSMVWSIAFAVAAGAVVALFLSLSSLRLSSDHFVIGSFALQLIISGIISNWFELTRGPLGLAGIPRPRLATDNPQAYFWIVAFTGLMFSVLLYSKLTKGALGRIFRTVRDDERLARSFGREVFGYKNVACCASGSLAALAGAIYAHYTTFIDPSSFSALDSVLLLSMVIVGGGESLVGALLGAAVMVLTPELLRFGGVSSSTVGNWRSIIFAALLLVFIIWRPNGLIGKYNLR